MKHTTMNVRKPKEPGGGPTVKPAPAPSMPVRIEFEHPNAKTVCVAGSFNNWRPQVTEMIPLGHGRWAKDLMLPVGTYEYLLVVDGQWIPDPRAQATVANPYGGRNCVMRVGPAQTHQPRPASSG